jgi:aerobic carbon-monoxide dehydrogenase medium subunit
VIPVPFEYQRPSTVDDAVRALADAGEDAKVLAGGQSLVPVLRLRLAAPSVLVDLGGIAELRGVREDGDDLVIAAMTRHADVLRDPLVRRYAPLLAQATATVADRQVRHLGTVGGSLSHADPAGDLPSVALALDATMEVVGPSGARRIPAADFFVDYLTTAMAPGEVLVAVRVPKREGWGTHYEKFNRVAQAWALVGVAATVRRDNGSIAEARVALTNMGPTPVRARAVEEALTGAPATVEAVAAAAERAAEGARPSDDIFASADYRTHLAAVLTRRAVAEAGGIRAA